MDLDDWFQPSDGLESSRDVPLSPSKQFDSDVDIMDILESRASVFPQESPDGRRTPTLFNNNAHNNTIGNESEMKKEGFTNEVGVENGEQTHSQAPPPRNQVLSDNLYQEIQTAVDAVADRLAQQQIDDPVDPGDLLLIMEVVIGDGRTGNIHIHRNDKAEKLASDFAITHGLNHEIIPTLVEHIKQQVDTMSSTVEAHREEPQTEDLAAVRPPPPPIEGKESQYNAMMDRYAQLASKTKLAATMDDPTLNNLRHSKLKPQTKQSQTPAACERLYALAQAREEWRAREVKRKEDEATREIKQRKLRLAEKSKAIVAKRTNGAHRSIGERLHSEALTEAAKRAKMAEARRVEKEAQHDWMCPKCAHFNKFSDKFCQNSKTKRGKGTTTNSATTPRQVTNVPVKATSSRQPTTPSRVCGQPKPALFQPTLVSTLPAKKAEETEQVLLRRHKHQEMAQALYHNIHTFTPQLNPNSKDIVREKRGCEEYNPYTALYEDASARRAKQQEKEEAYLKQFPFKPDIGLHQPPVSPNDWVTRLAVVEHDKLEEKKRKLMEKHAVAKDATTGRPFFKPEVGRSPQFARNDTNLPIGEFLYQTRHELHQIHQTLQKEHEESLRASQTQSFMSSASRALLETRKARSYDQIYKLLKQACLPPSPTSKHNKDALCPALLPVDSLPSELAHVAQCLFDVCGYGVIEKSAFHEQMDKTLAQCPGLTHTQVLFFSDKSVPLSSKAQQEAEEECELTFRPKINSTSIDRPKNVNVYEQLHGYHKTYKAKRDARKAKYDEMLHKECPFQPKLVAKSRFNDMYDGLPDEDKSNDEDAVILQTSKPLARPYVRPIGDDYPSEEASSIHQTSVNRSPLGPVRPRIFSLHEQPASSESHHEVDEDDHTMIKNMAVHPLPMTESLQTIDEEKEGVCSARSSPMLLLFGGLNNPSEYSNASESVPDQLALKQN